MSGLNLSKAQKVDITKGANLREIAIAAGWDIAGAAGGSYDLDIFLVGLDASNNPIPNKVVFFNQKDGIGGCQLDGDNLTGEGDGDDETITINVPAIEPGVESLVLAINIFDAASRGQNFGMVRNAYVRIYNKDNNEELVKFDLSEDYGVNTAVVAGKLYKHNEEWKFQAMGEGLVGDINDVVAKTAEITAKF